MVLGGQKMKKGLILLLSALLITGCTQPDTTTTEAIPEEEVNMYDNAQFKEDYEAVNGTYDEQRKHDYIEVIVREDVPVKYGTTEDFNNAMKNKETGIYYFGFIECPWCRTLVPSLLDATAEAMETIDIEYLVYINNRATRDVKELVDGKIVTTQEGDEAYYELLDLLKDYLPAYGGLEDESIKHLYYPTIVLLKEGEVQSFHMGTLDEQEDVWTPLTDEQRQQLTDTILENLMTAFNSEEGCKVGGCD